MNSINELKKIIDNPDNEARQRDFERWQREFLVEITKYRSVTNYSVLSLDERNVVWDSLLIDCAHEMFEKDMFSTERNNYRCKVSIIGLKK